MKLSFNLKKALQKALKSLYACEIPLEQVVCTPTEKNYEGTYTFPMFRLAGQLKMAPELVAQQAGEWLVKETPWVASYQVVKGFLNLSLTRQAWHEMLRDFDRERRSPTPSTGRNIVVEFSCPNTNKPLHLGHLRNNFIGSALANILRACGHTVHRVNLINDRGIHICKSMIAYQLFGEGKVPADMGLKGDHFVGHYYVLFDKEYQRQISSLTQELGSKEKAAQEAPIMRAAQEMLTQWEAGDEGVRALWQKMNQWVYEGLDATYARTDTTFDRVDYESQTYLLGKRVVAEGVDKGLFHTHEDGSIWADLQAAKLDKKLLIRSNGTTIYITQDMGTIDSRYEAYHFDAHIYVVGNEQRHHFKVLFEIMKQLERPYADKLYHLSYGMVDLPSGKMKSREGTTVDADALIDDMVKKVAETTQTLGKVDNLSQEEAHALYEVLGVGAIKYFLLRVNPQKRMLFNPEESIDLHGCTASFIQYTHARIHTMLEKGGRLGKEFGLPTGWTHALEPSEQEVILQLSGYTSALEAAAKEYNPALLADYVYHLAKAYNGLYAALPIIQAGNPELLERRLYLSSATAHVIRTSMQLLGIEVPERM